MQQELICDVMPQGSDTIFLLNSGGCDSLLITEYIYNPIEFEVVSNYIGCGEDITAEIVIINSLGASPVMYAIDGGGYKEQTSFTIYADGNYNITARDTNGCNSEIELN